MGPISIGELSEMLGVKETTLRNQFKREQERQQKKGIFIRKVGRGDAAKYFIDYSEVIDDQRALTIFDEEKTEIFLTEDIFRMMDWKLIVFMGICITPMLVFRGSYKDFLNYTGIRPSEDNVKILKETLNELNNECIAYLPDKTDDTYFVASLYRQIEKDYNIPIKRLRACRKIQIDNKGRSFIPLLKVWMAVEKAVENQPYTINDICSLTGYSRDTVCRVSKQLREANVYISKNEYIPELGISKGTSSTMNALADFEGEA